MKTGANPQNNFKWPMVAAVVLGVGSYIYLTNLVGGTENNRGSILFDTFLFYFWLVFWHFFFAQFVLPVHTLTERRMIFTRLLQYLFGRHGPAVLIQNGQVKQRKNEMNLRKPGVALIDAASAAMLRTDVEYTRPVGPGVVFTNSKYVKRAGSEYFSAEDAVDLRPQFDLRGPGDEDDPFAALEPGKNALFEAKKKQRYQTSGQTRNGIEVVPKIRISFQLNTQPGLGGTQFGYNGFAVRLAVTGEGIDPDPPDVIARRRIVWKKLPVLLAADVWREAIGIFTLDELFQDLPPDMILPGPPRETGLLNPHPPTGLEFISAWVQARLTQELVDELDTHGRRTGKRIFSREYKLLRSRGIRVKTVYISNLHFESTVEKDLVHRWDSTWYQRAMAERAALELQLSTAQASGQETARQEYAQAVTQRVNKLVPGIEHSCDEILLELVESSLQVIVKDAQLQKRAVNEKNALLDLITWIQSNPTP